MKKFITIILMFVCIAASAQIKKVSNDPLCFQYMFEVGEYVFTGFNIHGRYELSCTVGYGEAEDLVKFIRTNKDKLNEKYGFTIKDVQEATANTFSSGVMTPYTTHCVSLEIITDDYYKWKELQAKEEKERLNSLNNIL